MNWDGVLIVKLTESVLIPLFLCYLIYRASIDDFRQFVNALHSPGASILVGYVLLITGAIMMKIMLYDDGKYVVGAGVGILAKSLTGTENAVGTPKDSIPNGEPKP